MGLLKSVYLLPQSVYLEATRKMSAQAHVVQAVDLSEIAKTALAHVAALGRQSCNYGSLQYSAAVLTYYLQAAGSG